jgi:cholesterol transport system auxiliary component
MLAGLAGVLLLAGCSILGAGNARERSTIFDLDPRVATDPSWPRVDWQMSLPSATASRITDSLRIAVRPTPNELQVYKGAVWSRSPTDMVEAAILRTLEDSGRIAAVARQGSGISAEYKLVLDLRRFESAYTAADMPPTVRIELNAKLLRSADQQAVASRTFLQENPAASAGIDDVVAAFEHGLQAVTGELAGWVLSGGSRGGASGQE